MVAKKNHYEVLELGKDAELIDIKKAYRRLALKHHPDRNGGSSEATEKFKAISEAYTILSDKVRRREYDVSLKHPSASVSAAEASTSPPGPSSPMSSPAREEPPTSSSTRTQGVRDAYRQFNHLFKNDPFFHDAFQDMDDAFAQRFDKPQDQKRDDADTSDGRWGGLGSLLACGAGGETTAARETNKVPWSEWIMNKLGIELSVTSVSRGADGSVVASAYSSKPSGTYSKKKTRTYLENGKQVKVMSMEKDGNRIEDKFIGGKMVERKVNGKIEKMPKLVAN